MAKKDEIAKDPAAAISEKLSQAPENKVAGQVDAPIAVEPAPAIDLTKLSPEQLSQLKGMLNATPDSVRNQKKNPIVSLRNFHGFKPDGTQFGGIIVDYQNAYNTLVRNEETNITSEVLMMKVKFLGDTEWTAIPWKDFMNADQVNCEVLSSRRVENDIDENPGKLIAKKEVDENGNSVVVARVPQLIKVVQDFFTVKLPDGTNPPTIEIEGRVTNS